MSPARWQQIGDLYHAAQERAPSERGTFLREACADDNELLNEVESLLAQDSIDGALERTAFNGMPPQPVAQVEPLPPGTQLGPYKIEGPLGEGGMGIVYLARDPRLDRQVAIKVLPSEMAADRLARERLRREAMAAAALDHPFICKIFEIGEEGDALFLVMEYLTGQTLRRRMLDGRIPLPEALRVAGEIAEALQEAHARGFLHRDLKPANIMLTENGHVKVMDFGLATRIANSPSTQKTTPPIAADQLTTPGTILGTPDYMSPEQVRGSALDARSDLFSFGVILAEMASGHHPFRRLSIAETLAAVLYDAPAIESTVPPPLVLVVRRLLAKTAADRFVSAADVRAELAPLAHTATPLTAVSRDAPFVGREAELSQLTQQMQEAVGGRGSLVMLGGEPGIGKTHLTAALLDAARLRGAFALTGHCYEMEGSPPYVPFIEMLEYTGRTASRENFRNALGEDAPEVAKLMPELRRMFPDIPPALELPPEQQRRFLFNSYRQFVERSARLRPLVALLEDFHWADEPTVLLLQHLAQAVASMPVLLIVTYRDVDLDLSQPFAQTLESMLRQKLGTRILLRRLPLAGVERMLAFLSAQQPPASLSRFVFAETEGNPFFVEEVFRHLAEEGKLFNSHGEFLTTLRLDQLQVPEGVRLLLGRRLERLSPDARRILTTAAVIGRAFPLPLLEELEKSHPDAVVDALEEAERGHLVEAEAVGSQTRYRFVHELVRQTLAETLSLPRRQRVHAAVAAALERVYQSSIDAHIPALAHHLFRAGSAVDQEKTIHFLGEAARRASAAAAHEEALVHWHNTLSLLEGERTVRTANLHIRRATALRSLLRNPEAIEECELALEIFESLGDYARCVETCVMLREIYDFGARFQDAKAVVDRAAYYALDGPASLRYPVLAMQAHYAGTTGEIDRALALLDELGKIPEADLPPDIIADAAYFEAFIRHFAGQMKLAEAAARKATKIFETSGNIWRQASIGHLLYVPAIYRGGLDEAEKLILEAIPRATRVGHINAEILATIVLAQIHLTRGYLDSAERIAREALAFAESNRVGWIFVVETGLARILLLRDKIADAFVLLTKAASGPKTYYSGFTHGLLALATAAGGMEGAVDACAAAMRFLPRPGASRGFGAWYAIICLTEALCLGGHRQDVSQLQTEAEKIAAEWSCNGHGFPVRTVAGIAAACAGNWDRAEEHHRAAIARVDAAPDVTAQPIARYWYADMLAERKGTADAEAAKALLAEAITASDAIGLALYARLARQKLAQIASR